MSSGHTAPARVDEALRRSRAVVRRELRGKEAVKPLFFGKPEYGDDGAMVGVGNGRATRGDRFPEAEDFELSRDEPCTTNVAVDGSQPLKRSVTI